MNPIFEQRLQIVRGTAATDVLILFLAADTLPEDDFAGIVEDQVGTHLAPDEMLLIVRESALDTVVKALTERRAAKAALQRFCGRTRIEVVGFDQYGAETVRTEIQLGPGRSGLDLPAIMRRGVTAIFRKRNGFVVSTPTYHFENPSGRHTDRFIRLSNILIRQAEISFIAFALLTHIPKDAVFAYVDTPALYSLVAAVNEHWRSLSPERRPLLADNFRSYSGLDEFDFGTIEEAVALISASSSGGLAGDLEQRGFDRARIVHVLFLGTLPDGLVVACDLARDDRTNPDGFADDRKVYKADECAYCAEGSTRIPLRGDQFDISGPQPKPVLVNRDDAPPKFADQMRRLQGTRILQVGLGNRTTGERLHHIAVSRLHESEAFGTRLRFMVRRYVPAGVRHCIAADRASLDLARSILDQIGAQDTAKLHDRNSLEQLRDRIRSRQEENTSNSGSDHEAADLGLGEPDDPVLVVATVIENGRMLLDVSRELRNIFPEAPIIYMVGVANTAGKARRDALGKTLGLTDRPAPHQLAVVEEMVLPPSSLVNAWNQELSLYREAVADGQLQLSETLAARRNRLEETSKPLIDELFLPADPTAPLRLQMGFAFWQDGAPGDPHSQADVFFTISSVLQQLRANAEINKPRALRSDWFQQTLLGPENFGRFNDGVIQSAILRAARPAELNYAGDREASAEARSVIRRILESSGGWRGEAAAEFLIAIGTGRLKLATDDLRQLLQPVPGAPPLITELIGLCARRLDTNLQEKSPSIAPS